MVTVAASAPAHNDTKFVFKTWINNTGWENNVICFITGLVNPLYSLGGLDGITVGSLPDILRSMLINLWLQHVTEEIPNVGIQQKDFPWILTLNFFLIAWTKCANCTW